MSILWAVIIVVLLAVLWYFGAFDWMLPQSLQTPYKYDYTLPPYLRNRASVKKMRNNVERVMNNLTGRNAEGCLGTLAKSEGRVGKCWVHTVTGEYSAARPPANQPGWINRCNYV